MKQRILQLKNGLMQCLKNFPVETLLGLIFLVLYIIDDTDRSRSRLPELLQTTPLLPLPYENALSNVLFLFPTLFILVYGCRTFFKRKYLYYVSAFIFIPLIFIRLDSFMFSIGYGFTLLLSFFLLLTERRRQDNESFAESSFQTVYHLGLSALFGLLFYAACALIYASVVFIFGLKDSSLFFSYMFAAVCFLVTPLLFCQLQQRKQGHWKPSKFIEIVLNFILSPGLIIYTGILYLYFITIAWQGELPKGGIAYMVLAFVIVALGGRVAQLIVSKRYYDWFYNYFSFIALPPLAIFWLGTLERICTYSWTESRVYLFAAGILMTMYLVFLLSKKLANYRMMLIISSASIAVLTFMPFISAKQLGIIAQQNRLERLAHVLNVWDDKEQTLKNEPAIGETSAYRKAEDVTGGSMVENENREQLAACLSYLQEELGDEKVSRLYGPATLSYLTGFSQKEGQNQQQSGRKEQTVIKLRNDELISVPEGYRSFTNLSYNVYNLHVLNQNTVCVKYRKSEQTVLSFQMDTQFGPYLEEILSKKENSVQNPALFRIKNDSCLLILHSIDYDTKTKKFRCSGGSLFFK